MTTKISDLLNSVSGRSLRSGHLLALLLLAAFTSLMPAPAQAQSADTWKSVAIIGGSTAAGAYIGHKVGGRTGTYVGAAVGATAGYAIDRRRRQNDYNNGYYGNNSYPSDNGGYYGNDPYQNDGGYYGGPGNQYPYGSGYQTNSYYRNDNGYTSRR
jgi:hypothetical protein